MGEIVADDAGDSGDECGVVAFFPFVDLSIG